MIPALGMVASLLAVLLGLFGSPSTSTVSSPATSAQDERAPLDWQLELPIAEIGGATDHLFAARDGAIWLAVSGPTTPEGRAKVFRRDPVTETWEERWRGPTTTDLHFSQPDERVVLSFGQPMLEYRPRVLVFHPDRPGVAHHVQELRPPLIRLNDLEYQQVGALVLGQEQEDWACGQLGALWRKGETGWQLQPFPFDADPLSQAHNYCSALRFDEGGLGHLSTVSGRSAWFDGEAWRPLDASDDAPKSFSHTTRLARDLDAFYRPVDDRWVALNDTCEGADAAAILATGVRVNFAGSVGISREFLVHFGATSWSCEAINFPASIRSVAEHDGATYVLSDEGVYRSSLNHELHFRPAPSGSLPLGLQYPLTLDIDDDGDDDLVAVAPLARDGTPSSTGVHGPLTLYRALGGGEFRREGEFFGGIESGVFPGSVALGDLDGDGDFDLALADRRRKLQIWRREADTYRLSQSFEGPATWLSFVDVDGDGDLDLCDDPEIYVNDGAGGFTPANINLGVGLFAAWADVDRDGDAEGVSMTWRDEARVAWNRSERGSLEFEVLALGTVSETGRFADFDHDTEIEYLAARVHHHSAALPFRVCEFDDISRCESQDARVVPAGIAGDLDLNGFEDIVVASTRADETPLDSGAIYLRDAAGFREVTAQSGRFVRPHLLDADGDGDLDIYSTRSGLFLNATDPKGTLKIELSLPRSNSRASGARLHIRTASGQVLSPTTAIYGRATLAAPEAAGASVEVLFPGESEFQSFAIGDATRLALSPERGAAALWAQLETWTAITMRLIVLGWHAAFPALLLITGVIVSRRRGRSLFVMAIAGTSWWLLAVGFAVRDPAWYAQTLGLGITTLVAGLGFTEIVELTLRLRRRRWAGSYRLVRPIGKGAAATVWLARHSRNDVALKLFNDEVLTDSNARERFFREAKLGSDLQHDHLISVKAFGALDDGRCFLAMELIEGGSLAQRLETGPIAWEEAAGIVSDVCRGLTVLHEAGVIHRDLKPANILLRADGRAVVADLGLARSEMAKTITRHDLAVGTLAYMSPEQAIGSPLDGRCDLWALGVVLYEAVGGELPLAATNELELLYLLHNVTPTPLAQLIPAVNADFSALVTACLTRSRQDRPESARALGRALDALTTKSGADAP